MLWRAKLSNPIRIKRFKQCKIIVFTKFSNSCMKGKIKIKENQLASACGKSFF